MRCSRAFWRRTPATPRLFEALIDGVFDLFETNIAAQTGHLPPLACRKGCPSCCIQRVTATAPEIFLLAADMQRIEAAPAGAAIGLGRRIALADRATRGLGETERMRLRKPCPFIMRGVCIRGAGIAAILVAIGAARHGIGVGPLRDEPCPDARPRRQGARRCLARGRGQPGARRHRI